VEGGNGVHHERGGKSATVGVNKEKTRGTSIWIIPSEKLVRASSWVRTTSPANEEKRKRNEKGNLRGKMTSFKERRLIKESRKNKQHTGKEEKLYSRPEALSKKRSCHSVSDVSGSRTERTR